MLDRKIPSRLFLATVALAALGSGEALARDQGDLLVAYNQNHLLEAPLPRGPLVASGAIDEFPLALAFGPDGQLYAIRQPTEEPFLDPRIARVGNDGELSDLGEIPLLVEEEAVDFVFGPEGKIHVLTFGLSLASPPAPFQRVLTLDPQTLELLDFQFLSTVSLGFSSSFRGIALGEEGFWLVSAIEVAALDLETGRLDPIDISALGIGAPLDADSDSTGAIWILSEPGIIDPPVFFLHRFDPVTGALREASFHPELVAGPMAIHRRCQNDETHRCLQGGRFRASVEWRDFADNTGPGRLAPNSSADSTLFWFFDAANWELLVKVLDGCDNNGHFWVFAGATTDVEFELTVNDLETGEVFRFENPLGNPPRTVNDTFAFSSCP